MNSCSMWVVELKEEEIDVCGSIHFPAWHKTSASKTLHELTGATMVFGDVSTYRDVWLNACAFY